MPRMSAQQSTADVAIVGLGRVGLPLALSFADRGLTCSASTTTRARLDAVRAGRMPFHETGAQELLDASRGGASRSPTAVADAAQARADRDHARHAVLLPHRDRHARHPLRARRPAAACSRPGHSLILRSTVAPGTTEFVAGYLRQAPRLRRRRGGVRRARARADRRGALPRGDRHAALHHRRRRRALRRGRRASCSRCSARRSCRRRRCRPSWRRSGRTSCATRTSRCPTC